MSSRNNDTFAALIDIGNSHPPLTAEEENQLTAAYFESDHDKWADIMVLHNVRFVIAQSSRYIIRGEERTDICGRLICGLEKAAQLFDPSKGVRFLTFAGYYMKDAVRDAVDPHLSAVRTNNATCAIIDRSVDNKEDTAATLGDFIGKFQSPDYVSSDPGSESQRSSESVDFRAIVLRICQVIESMPVYGTADWTPGSSAGFRMTRGGIKRLSTVFRLHYADSLSYQEIAALRNCRIEIIRTSIRVALSYIRHELVHGHGAVAEINEFFSRSGIPTETEPSESVTIDRTKDQFSKQEIADALTSAAEDDSDIVAAIEEENPSDSAEDIDIIPDVPRVQESDSTSDETAPVPFVHIALDTRDSSTTPPVHEKTIYRDAGFYTDDRAFVEIKYRRRGIKSRNAVEDGLDVSKARKRSKEQAFSLYGYARHMSIPFDRLLTKKPRYHKRTKSYRPFYGNFYSEWTHCQLARRKSTVLTGDAVRRLIEDGSIRASDCFRISGGELAYRIR